MKLNNNILQHIHNLSSIDNKLKLYKLFGYNLRSEKLKMQIDFTPKEIDIWHMGDSSQKMYSIDLGCPCCDSMTYKLCYFPQGRLDEDHKKQHFEVWHTLYCT